MNVSINFSNYKIKLLIDWLIDWALRNWRSLTNILRRDKEKSPPTPSLTAQQLWGYFVNKISDVRPATNDADITSFLPAGKQLTAFRECTENDIRKLLRKSPPSQRHVRSIHYRLTSCWSRLTYLLWLCVMHRSEKAFLRAIRRLPSSHLSWRSQVWTRINRRVTDRSLTWRLCRKSSNELSLSRREGILQVVIWCHLFSQLIAKVNQPKQRSWRSSHTSSTPLTTRWSSWSRASDCWTWVLHSTVSTTIFYFVVLRHHWTSDAVAHHS